MATLNLSISVPDAQAAQILADFCAHYGYQETLLDPDGNPIPNPQTRAQFAKAQVARFVKNSLAAYRANRDAEAARAATLAEVEAIVIE